MASLTPAEREALARRLAAMEDEVAELRRELAEPGRSDDEWSDLWLRIAGLPWDEVTAVEEVRAQRGG